MSSVPHASAVVSLDSEACMGMLRSIFEQNSQILAQNMNARLTVVEKEMEKASQRALIRNRPRVKSADGLP